MLLEIREEISFGEYHVHKVKRHLFSGRTKFHDAEVVEFVNGGLALLLDGRIQSCQTDEFVYNEAAVHASIIMHPSPQTVLCLAGSYGGIIREVLKHKCVKEVIAVDEDCEVSKIIDEYLPHMKAPLDKRLTVYYGDCIEYLRKNVKYDIIIFDSPDIFPRSRYEKIFSRNSIMCLFNALSSNGLIALQVSAIHPSTIQRFYERINLLSEVFSFVYPYHAEVHTLGTSWGFALASSKQYNIRAINFNSIMNQRLSSPTRFLDEDSYNRMWLWPKHLKLWIILGIIDNFCTKNLDYNRIIFHVNKSKCGGVKL